MPELTVIAGKPLEPDDPGFWMPCFLTQGEAWKAEAARLASIPTRREALRSQGADRRRERRILDQPSNRAQRARKENAMREDLETAIASLTRLLPHIDALAEFTSLEDAIAAEGKRYDDLSAANTTLAATNAELTAKNADLIASIAAIRKRLGA